MAPRTCRISGDSTFPGRSVFWEGDCSQPTSVYVPPQLVDMLGTRIAGKKKWDQDHNVKDAKYQLDVNVVVWLHGWYVQDQRFLFDHDLARIREEVFKSGKSVILVAPFLGHGDLADHARYSANVATLKTTNWGQSYLTEILEDLPFMLGLGSATSFTVQNLAIACHSGGGAAMLNLVDSVGKFGPQLRECWGFDCLYHVDVINGKKVSDVVTDTDDPASLWFKWVQGAGKGKRLFIAAGPGTIWQSIKLYLLGQGKVGIDGKLKDPPGTKIPKSQLEVTLAHYQTVAAFGRIVNVDVDTTIDTLVSSSPLTKAQIARGVAPSKPTSLHQMIEWLVAGYSFPDDRGIGIQTLPSVKGEDDSIHYWTAREFFLSQLKRLPWP